MIKLETHCHVKGGSGCAKVEPEQLVSEYEKAGYGAIVITNHYCEECYNTYPTDSHKGKLDFYFSLRDNVRLFAEKKGIKVFTGAEVRVVTPDKTYSEYMLYGFDDAFFYDNKPLFYLTQKELFELAEKKGLLMYQTHPFRIGVMTGNPKFMHGAETFNGHGNHRNNNQFADHFCDKYNLIKISGTDYHDPEQRKTGGIYIPENINTNKQLVDYIFNNQFELFCDKETYKKRYLEIKKQKGRA